MSTPSEKTNLARIRDNQRRSRARRKEYLQELERRLRLVELQGIEASAEIQAAARKVAEENKKFRTLLIKHGISDDSIDAFLGSGILAPPGDPSIAAQYHTAASGNSVKTLEQLLGPRRPTCIEPGAPLFPIPAGMPGSGRMGDFGGRDSRETSVTSISTVLDNPSSQHGRSLSGSLPSQTSRLPPQSQYMGTGGLGRTDGQGIHGLGSVMESHRPSQSNSTNSHPDRQQHQTYNYDMQLLHNPSAYNRVSQRRPELSTHPYPISPVTGAYLPSTSGSNAVDAMSSVQSSDHQHMRNSLGLPILDCEVDNAAFNHALDRYTATTLGM